MKSRALVAPIDVPAQLGATVIPAGSRAVNTLVALDTLTYKRLLVSTNTCTVFEPLSATLILNLAVLPAATAAFAAVSSTSLKPPLTAFEVFRFASKTRYLPSLFFKAYSVSVPTAPKVASYFTAVSLPANSSEPANALSP